MVWSPCVGGGGGEHLAVAERNRPYLLSFSWAQADRCHLSSQGCWHSATSPVPLGLDFLSFHKGLRALQQPKKKELGGRGGFCHHRRPQVFKA